MALEEINWILLVCQWVIPAWQKITTSKFLRPQSKKWRSLATGQERWTPHIRGNIQRRCMMRRVHGRDAAPFSEFSLLSSCSQPSSSVICTGCMKGLSYSVTSATFTVRLFTKMTVPVGERSPLNFEKRQGVQMYISFFHIQSLNFKYYIIQHECLYWLINTSFESNVDAT